MIEYLLIPHAWHNQGMCLLSPEKFHARIEEVLQDKPEDELDLRLHYLGAAVDVPPKAQVELDRAQVEWDTKWHKKLCHPNCAWTPENQNVFAKGKSLARLLEVPASEPPGEECRMSSGYAFWGDRYLQSLMWFVRQFRQYEIEYMGDAHDHLEWRSDFAQFVLWSLQTWDRVKIVADTSPTPAE